MRTVKRTLSRTVLLVITTLMLTTGLSSCIAAWGRDGWHHRHDRDRRSEQFDRRDRDR